MKSSKFQILLLFLLISGLIVTVWFKNVNLYGGAEVGLAPYNPQRWLEISKYVWWESVAPGQLVPHFIVGVPFYFFFNTLQLIGFSASHLQQLFFFIILFLMGFSMYILSNHIFDEDRKKYSIIAGLFYMFNSYTLVMVWHRFLYTTFLLAAVLPLIVLFWMKWIKEGKLINLIIFLLINFLSVYMYGNLASVITVWVSLTLVSLAQIFIPWSGKVMLEKIGLRFLGGLIFWFLTNAWWIAPTYLIAPGLLSQQHSSEDNLGTLVVISRQTIMPYLLQLVNPFYLFFRAELGEIYGNVIFKTLPWIMSLLIFFGLIISLKLKNYAKYSLIFIIALLFAKGSATPFSYPYIFGFQYLYILGVLRNPFEKLGIMMPMFGAIIFVIGLQSFYYWGNKRFGIATKFIFTFVLLVLVGYAWPMFTGSIFGSKDFPIKVKIPESYIETDKWFKQQKDNEGVILHLPFAGSDVVTYKWDIGYHGVNQDAILFSSLPSLSKVVGVKRVDDTLNSLTYIFNKPFSEDKSQILRVLQFFNVKYIVLHKDIEWEDKDTYGEKTILLEPGAIEKVLNNLDFLEKVNQFGQLVVYKLREDYYEPILSLTDDIQLVYPGKSDIMKILSLSANMGDIVTPVSRDIDNRVFPEARQILIFPDSKIEYLESSNSAQEAMVNNILQNPYSSQSPFNQLLQIKAYFDELGDLQSAKLTGEIFLATQNLLGRGKISDYEKSIDDIFAKYSPDLKIHRLFNSYVIDVLRLHLFALRQMKEKRILDKLEREMVRVDLLPQYRLSDLDILTNRAIHRQVFKFNVPIKGEYELLLDNQENKISPNLMSEIDVRINDERISQKVQLDERVYEISYKAVNILKGDIVLKITGTNVLSPKKEKVLSLKRENSVSYSGKLNISKPTFVFFKQTYDPGWSLKLSKNNKAWEVKEHFLGNLYGNAWWVDQVGEYDFKIEFTPQQNVTKGMVVAFIASILLIGGGLIRK